MILWLYELCYIRNCVLCRVPRATVRAETALVRYVLVDRIQNTVYREAVPVRLCLADGTQLYLSFIRWYFQTFACTIFFIYVTSL